METAEKALDFSATFRKTGHLLVKCFTQENSEIGWKIGNKSSVKKRDQVARKAQKRREVEIVT
jgi:hypothetical protein